MLEPFGVAHHAVSLARLNPGSNVAVFGAGAIGLCILHAALFAGAGRTFVIDPLPYRLDFAKRLYGADRTIDDSAVDAVAFIRDATGGRGVDVVFDAAGKERAVQAAMDVAAPGGRVVLVGIPTYDFVSYNPHVARTKELTLINVRRSNQTLRTCLDLLDCGRIKLKPMVTHRFALSDIQHAFEVASEYGDGVIKAMVVG